MSILISTSIKLSQIRLPDFALLSAHVGLKDGHGLRKTSNTHDCQTVTARTFVFTPTIVKEISDQSFQFDIT